MTWFPGWAWFVSPSGGPYDTLFWKVKNMPLVAHPIGAAVVVFVFLGVLRSPAVPAVGAALLAEGVNQFYKAVAGVYGSHLWVNVIWRLILAGVGALAVLLV